ncbi:MAG: hypothetical protein ACFCUJ_04870 [Thiotrichales bacterium]
MIEREVAASVNEFTHGLRLAAPGAVTQTAADRFEVASDDADLVIRVRPFGERRLGALVLPLQWVSYECVRGDASAFKRLLARLDFAMQRGGG